MTLRPFILDDWSVIQQYQYPNLTESEIRAMISQWNTCRYDGRYFEMLAIEIDSDIVGYVSLFEQADGTVSEGVEIYTPYRRLGFAYSAIKMLLQHALNRGFKKVTAQVQHNNVASLALHKKLDFQISDSYTNKRGHSVYVLHKNLTF